MAESYEVTVKVVSQKGTCAARHKVGDKWVIKDEKAPAGLCIYALNSLFPFTQVLMFGGTFPWGSNPDVTTVACPDPESPVDFELRRIRKT